jgi:hypothetical protein
VTEVIKEKQMRETAFNQVLDQAYKKGSGDVVSVHPSLLLIES